MGGQNPLNSFLQDLKGALVLLAQRRPNSLIHDVRFAIRGLLRQPGFPSAVILLLALAIGANVAMFSAFYQALIRPLPYFEPERLVMGYATFKGKVNPDMSVYDILGLSRAKWRVRVRRRNSHRRTQSDDHGWRRA